MTCFDMLQFITRHTSGREHLVSTAQQVGCQLVTHRDMLRGLCRITEGARTATNSTTRSSPTATAGNRTRHW